MENGISKNGNLKCPICGSADKLTLADKAGRYDVYDCGVCGGSFSDPMEEGGGEYYEESYGAEGAGYGENKEEYTRFFKDAENLHLGGSLLEIGCGPGYFLKLAAEKGFEVFGVDPNKKAVEHAVSIGLKDVRHGSVDEIRKMFPEKKFDSIVLFSVLEHLKNPIETIKAIKSYLSPGGHFFVVVPNKKRSSLRFVLRKARQGWDYPPHHLTRWSEGALDLALKAGGFTEIYIEETKVSSFFEAYELSYGWIYLNLNSIIKSLRGKKVSESMMPAATSVGGGKSGVYTAFRAAALGIVGGILTPFVYALSKIIKLKATQLYARADLTS